MDTKTKYLCKVICPEKFTLAHNVFEVIELYRTRADILKPTLDRTLLLRRTLKYKQNPQCRSFGVDMWAEKELIFIYENLPQNRFQSNFSFLNLIVSRR